MGACFRFQTPCPNVDFVVSKRFISNVGAYMLVMAVELVMSPLVSMVPFIYCFVTSSGSPEAPNILTAPLMPDTKSMPFDTRLLIALILSRNPEASNFSVRLLYASLAYFPLPLSPAMVLNPNVSGLLISWIWALMVLLSDTWLFFHPSICRRIFWPRGVEFLR